jgi:hypothetical protein
VTPYGSDLTLGLVASTAADPADVVGGVRGAMTSLVPDLPLTIRPMSDVVAENEIQWSPGSIFLGIFGGGALLLATLGIYGLVSFSVVPAARAARTDPIGALRAE